MHFLSADIWGPHPWYAEALLYALIGAACVLVVIDDLRKGKWRASRAHRGKA